jgi:putative PIG3 family NAD(P)H quinone oxidoreductase
MRDIPATMQAIDPGGAGGPEVLAPVERPVPQPGAGEVLVRVAAAGVNRPDVLQRQGKYPPPPGASSILGLEIAGGVVALGDGVDAALLDTNVCALVAGGGYAQYCVAPAAQCLPVPQCLSLSEAAAIPETLFTVWSNVFQRGAAKAGDVLLVHGGTSGIGTMAIHLGKLFGLKVITTAGSAEKCARALEIGADHGIDYRTQDFVAEVQSITAGRGVDVVLDMVGGDYVARNIACMAVDGRHVSIAVLGGLKGDVFIPAIMQKRLTLTGSTLRAREAAFKAALTDELRERVWPKVIDGSLRPIIDSVYPLARAADAHARMDGGAHVGKIVLEIAAA